jgi:hypothetical protein
MSRTGQKSVDPKNYSENTFMIVLRNLKAEEDSFKF